jgi:adenosylcobinamide-GDP ribazoletransferase
VLRPTRVTDDLLTAFMLLTRLPLSRFARADTPPDLARCVWAFPVVGFAVNGLGGLVCWLLHKAGVPPLLAAAWVLATTVILTGGFHEDGLADTADGFGGGSSPIRKLEIMRDSRIGSYGALALLLSVMIRAAAIAALVDPTRVVAAMIVAGMLGRTGMLVILLALRPARAGGMGAAMGKIDAKSAAVGFGLTIVAALVWLPIRPALAMVILGIGASTAVAKLAHTQIGGYTGDVLGAAEVITECVALTVATVIFSP